MTEGLLVLVQLVMEAIKTLPCRMLASAGVAGTPTGKDFSRLAGVLPKPLSAIGLVRAEVNSRFKSVTWIRSCGRFGPATLDTTVPKSRSRLSE